MRVQMKVSSIAYLSLLYLGQAHAELPRKILVHPLQGDCSLQISAALVSGLTGDIPVEQLRLPATEQGRDCLGEQCIYRYVAVNPGASQSLQDAWLIGGQLDQSDNLLRYRIWAYNFNRNRTAYADKSFYDKPTVAELKKDLVRSFRALLENFDSACCSNATEQREQTMSTCAPPVTGNPAKPALLLMHNQVTVGTARRKDAADFAQFNGVINKGTSSASPVVRMNLYSGGNASAIARMELPGQAAWLQQHHYEQLIRLQWDGLAYQLELCVLKPTELQLQCRRHHTPIEERPGQPERMREDLVSRLNDLYFYVPVASPSDRCQQPFAIDRCLALPTATEVEPPQHEETDEQKEPAPTPRPEPPLVPAPVIRPAVGSVQKSTRRGLAAARIGLWSTVALGGAAAITLAALSQSPASPPVLSISGEDSGKYWLWQASGAAAFTGLTTLVGIAVEFAYHSAN